MPPTSVPAAATPPAGLTINNEWIAAAQQAPPPQDESPIGVNEFCDKRLEYEDSETPLMYDYDLKGKASGTSSDQVSSSNNGDMKKWAKGRMRRRTNVKVKRMK